MRDVDSIRAWLYISKTYQFISSENQREFRGYGLTTPQFDIIVNLGFRGPLNQNALADYLLVTKGNISTVIKGLEKKGFIERHTPLADRRFKMVQLTEEGERVYKMTVKKHEENLSSLLSVLSEKERQSLVEILKKLYYKLKEAG